MSSRDPVLLNLRPEIPSAKINPSMSDDEFFQNNTLRPIAKLRNDLLVEVFKHYIKKHKNVFIENAIHKDTKFRNSLKGIIIGMFTIDEHREYTKNSSSLNKRMMAIVKERIKSNIILFEYELV